MYAQGIGVVSDGETMVVLGFKTQREIITKIGYLSSDAENVLLHACFNALCERMTGQPTVAANSPQTDGIAAALCDVNGFEDGEEKFAVLAELALKHSVRDYASKRRAGQSDFSKAP